LDTNHVYQERTKPNAQLVAATDDSAFIIPP